MDLAAWGIDKGYWDASGQWRDVPETSVDAVASAMRAEGRERPPEPPPIWFVQAGHIEFLHGPADLNLEDGTTVRNVEALPPDLPPGYHDLVPRDGGPTTRLIVTPGRCHLPQNLRTWGWAVQLYAARSRESWGIGDLADLRRLQGWAASQGAGVLALNPLHAPGPALPQQASPYYPSSRRFRSPLFLRVEEAPGAAEAGADLERLAAQGRALVDDRIIDRDRVWALKRQALELAFAKFRDDSSFEQWVKEQGQALHQFATYCVLADEHGNGWQSWPTELRRPDAPAVQRFAADHPQAISFHSWLQWLLELQLARTADFPVIHDLAVGFDPGGVDAWAWQDVLALDMRVGAPPDEFVTEGQNWGLPPFVPWMLRAQAYEPFIETVRSALQHAGGLRIDHVMGLFRLFWVPEGASAREGAYVRYTSDELLAILALESHRAGAFVVGEDLGTVEDTARAALAEHNVLSYRLLWFEPGPPSTYPVDAVAAMTTHDLPTVAGCWTRSDLDDQRTAGLEPNTAAEDEVHHRLASITGADPDEDSVEVATRAYAALATSPSRVVLATLEDALGVTERPNMPSTTDTWPNWNLAIPTPIEDLETADGPARIAEAMRGAGRSGS